MSTQRVAAQAVPTAPPTRLRPVARHTAAGPLGLAVIGAHLVAVTWLWAADGVDLTAGLLPALASLGRLVGLWSAVTLLAQVVTMARLPWLERAYGQDTLTRWHRWIGFASFWLLVTHLFAEVLASGGSPVAALWDLTVSMPGVLLALAGFVLIVGIAATSVRAARRRLRYESWHLLHLYAYLGIGLAIPHTIWAGSDLAGRGAITTYAWAVWAITAVALVTFRLLLPWLRALAADLRVVAVEPAGPGALTVTVAGPGLARMRAEAGQFFVWRFRTGPGWTRGHPYSLSAVPTTAGLRTTIGVRGDDGARLAALVVGTRVWLEGPYGRLTTGALGTAPVVAFGAGLGVAPLVGLLADRAPGSGDVIVTRDRTATPLAADVATLVTHHGVRHVALVGPRGADSTWLPAHLAHLGTRGALARLVPDPRRTTAVVCGPSVWARGLAKDLHRAGVEHVHVERYDW